jgi:hypothetical protein
MRIEAVMEKSGAYVASQRHWGEPMTSAGPQVQHPAITISHQTGAGAPEIAEQLAGVLQKTELTGTDAWAVFDQKLIERALLQQGWPKKLAAKITEEKRLFIDEFMDDLFRLRPPSWIFVPQVTETTLYLAMVGHVILVGHGATLVTAKLSNVFHVRLTGSLFRRIERIQNLQGLTPAAAAKFVKLEDYNREKYLKAHFHARLDNELLYDLAINTDRVSDADAVAIIADAARRFFTPGRH